MCCFEIRWAQLSVSLVPQSSPESSPPNRKFMIGTIVSILWAVHWSFSFVCPAQRYKTSTGVLDSLQDQYPLDIYSANPDSSPASTWTGWLSLIAGLQFSHSCPVPHSSPTFQCNIKCLIQKLGQLFMLCIGCWGIFLEFIACTRNEVLWLLIS